MHLINKTSGDDSPLNLTANCISKINTQVHLSPILFLIICGLLLFFFLLFCIHLQCSICIKVQNCTILLKVIEIWATLSNLAGSLRVSVQKYKDRLKSSYDDIIYATADFFFFWPMGSKHCNNDARKVWTRRGTMLKNKHLVTFNGQPMNF